MDYLESLKKLTAQEFKVLKLKCKGLKYEQIAGELGYSLEWVQLQMSNVYLKLGFSKSMHWTVRTKLLGSEICPKLPEDFEDLIPIKEEIKEQVPDPEMMAIVLRDEAELLKKEVLTGEVIDVRPQRRTGNLGRNFLVLMVVILGAVIVYLLNRPQNPPKPITVVITATSLPSPTPADTSPAVPTTAPIDTPLPTETKVMPTFTAKPYYNQGEAVPLKDKVHMYMGDEFNSAGGPCSAGDLGFGLSLYVNNSSSDQFILRFNTGSFHATDNVGTEYELSKAWIPFTTTSDLLGTDVSYQLRNENRICLIFKGQIPLQANYLLITADFISGVGPTVFRKDI